MCLAPVAFCAAIVIAFFLVLVAAATVSTAVFSEGIAQFDFRVDEVGGFFEEAIFLWVAFAVGSASAFFSFAAAAVLGAIADAAIIAAAIAIWVAEASAGAGILCVFFLSMQAAKGEKSEKQGN